MGTYTTLVHDSLACPFCLETSPYEIQFKYGSCSCASVRLGDEIEWESSLRFSYGRPVGGRVQVGGCVLQPCPRCAREAEALLTIDDDRLGAVELVRELPSLGVEGCLQLGGQRRVHILPATRGRNSYVECPHCRWKSDTCTDPGEPTHVYCERCGNGISRPSWATLNV